MPPASRESGAGRALLPAWHRRQRRGRRFESRRRTARWHRGFFASPPYPSPPAKDTPQARPRHQDAFIGARRPAPPTGDTRSPRDARSPSGTPAPPQRHPLPLRDTRSPGQPHGGCDDPVGPGVPHSTPPSPVPPHPPAGEGPGALAGRGRGRRGHPGVRVANASCIFWRQRA